ncbi:hypothetical protein [Nocardiopsis suaedae]|uniref:Secreted protein n=1 Tax=Nocardiopsis suaedae TaxID=3018444 RepID=A0ABT4TNI2_9ACTN|nr:hypothetical protein [Nocardiopsis suaedae]MDA2805926.1 hypothetical protein [Nocardiopsis suaedae]
MSLSPLRFLRSATVAALAALAFALASGAAAAAPPQAEADARCIGGPLLGTVLDYCPGALPAGRTADWLDDTRRFDTGQLQGTKRVYALDDGTDLTIVGYEDGVVRTTPDELAQGDERFAEARPVRDARGRTGLAGDGAVLILLSDTETAPEEGPFTVEVSTRFPGATGTDELLRIAGHVTAAPSG